MQEKRFPPRGKLSPQATDEGKVCHYNPFMGNFRKLAPHPALRATFPRRGRHFTFPNTPAPCPAPRGPRGGRGCTGPAACSRRPQTGLWDTLWEPACAALGLPLPADMEKFRAGGRGLAGDNLRRHVAEYIPGDPQKVLDKIWQLADERFARGVPCKKGLKELLAALEDMGLPRIVASSSPRNMIEMNLQTTGTARYFHDVVSGTEVAHSKPAPDTFLVAAKKLHLDPHDCLVLEDSFNGVRAGRAAGCVTVMVPDLMQPTEEIAQLYDRKCEDLLEVRDLLIEGKL